MLKLARIRSIENYYIIEYYNKYTKHEVAYFWNKIHYKLNILFVKNKTTLK